MQIKSNTFHEQSIESRSGFEFSSAMIPCLRLYLYSIFSPFGAIQSVRLLKDSMTGVCTGAALLKYGITEDAELAIRTLSGNKLPDGVVLDVTVKTVRS